MSEHEFNILLDTKEQNIDRPREVVLTTANSIEKINYVVSLVSSS